MSQAIPLSWSRLGTYRTCPRQFESKYLSKTYPEDKDNPAFIKGSAIHKQLENYILWKKDPTLEEPQIGKEAKNAIPIIDNLFDTLDADNIYAERQLAVDLDWKQCDWFDSPDVIKYRAIIDMLAVGGDHVSIIDFKTGKVRPYDEDFGQLHLTATIIFHLMPSVSRITCAYLFVEHKQTIKVDFHRDDLDKLRAKFDVDYITVNQDTEFEPSKNRYCHWCAIKKECRFG